MGPDSRSRPSVLWMKSIPVQVGGPGLTSGQSPTYYEHNNGLTGIIEPRASPRSIALLYPLCRFMTPRDGEEDSSRIAWPGPRGHVFPARLNEEKKSGGEKTTAPSLLFLSSLRVAFSHVVVVVELSRYRFRISELRCEGKLERIHFFFSFRSRTKRRFQRRSRISIIMREALSSSLSSRALLPFIPPRVTGRERKRACVSRASSSRDISNAVATSTDPPLGSNPVYRRDRIEEDRVFGNLTRSIHGC